MDDAIDDHDVLLSSLVWLQTGSDTAHLNLTHPMFPFFSFAPRVFCLVETGVRANGVVPWCRRSFGLHSEIDACNNWCGSRVFGPERLYVSLRSLEKEATVPKSHCNESRGDQECCLHQLNVVRKQNPKHRQWLILGCNSINRFFEESRLTSLFTLDLCSTSLAHIFTPVHTVVLWLCVLSSTSINNHVDT